MNNQTKNDDRKLGSIKKPAALTEEPDRSSRLIYYTIEGNSLTFFSNNTYKQDQKEAYKRFISFYYIYESFKSLYKDFCLKRNEYFKAVEELKNIIHTYEPIVDRNMRDIKTFAEKAHEEFERMKKVDHGYVFRKQLEESSDSILLMMFDKSIRFTKLRLVEGYERGRVQRDFNSRKFNEGGNRIIELLLNQERFIKEKKLQEIIEASITKNHIIENIENIITEFNSTNSIIEFLTNAENSPITRFVNEILEYFEFIQREWVKVRYLISDMHAPHKIQVLEYNYWDALSNLEQEKIASKFINAEIAYLKKKVAKLSHRVVVYDTIGRLTHLDTCVEDTNKVMKNLDTGISTMSFTGDLYLHNNSRTASVGGHTYSYIESSLSNTFQINKLNVSTFFHDPNSHVPPPRQGNYEEEKRYYDELLRKAEIRRSNLGSCQEHYNKAVFERDNYQVEVNNQHQTFENSLIDIQKKYDGFINAVENKQNNLKRRLILIWFFKFLSFLTLTRFSEKGNKQKFLCTRVTPLYIINLLYKILLKDKKIRKKRFRLFSRAEVEKVFGCSLISFDHLLELYFHPVVYGCFKQDGANEGQGIRNFLRSEECKVTIFHCIRETVKIFAIALQGKNLINVDENKSYLKQVEDEGFELLEQLGYNSLSMKLRNYSLSGKKKNN